MMEDEKEKRASFWLICRTLFAIFTVQPPSSLVGTWTESSSNVFLPLYVFFAFFFTCFFRASTHCKSPGGGGGDWVSAFQFAALFSGNLPAMWFRSEWERKRKSENCECVFVCVCECNVDIFWQLSVLSTAAAAAEALWPPTSSSRFSLLLHQKNPEQNGRKTFNPFCSTTTTRQKHRQNVWHHTDFREHKMSECVRVFCTYSRSCPSMTSSFSTSRKNSIAKLFEFTSHKFASWLAY